MAPLNRLADGSSMTLNGSKYQSLSVLGINMFFLVSNNFPYRWFLTLYIYKYYHKIIYCNNILYILYYIIS